MEFSGQTGLGVEDILEHLTEQWTAAPEESDDEDAGLKAALQAREETDEKEADESEPVVPMTLCQARSAAQALKIFVQENQSVEAMRGYLKPIEDLVSDWRLYDSVCEHSTDPPRTSFSPCESR